MIKDEDKDDKEQIKELLFASKSNNNIKFEKKNENTRGKMFVIKKFRFQKKFSKTFYMKFLCF